jgi:hypothetical protein
VTRLDPVTGKYVDTIGNLGGDLNDIAVGFDSVWVANGNDGTVSEIDPPFYQAAPPIQLGRQTLAPDPVFYIAVDSHYVWATRGTQLLRIDPHNTSHWRVWANVGSPTGLTTGRGYVWVTTGSDYLLRIDPQKPDNVLPHLLPAQPSEPVFARGSLWLIEGSEVQQIHPRTLSAGYAFPVANHPSSLAAGKTALWVIAYNRKYRPSRLVRVAPNGRQTTPLRVGESLSMSAVATGGSAAWVAVSPAG